MLPTNTMTPIPMSKLQKASLYKEVASRIKILKKIQIEKIVNVLIDEYFVLLF